VSVIDVATHSVTATIARRSTDPLSGFKAQLKGFATGALRW
jgi:hypothetical protein